MKSTSLAVALACAAGMANAADMGAVDEPIKLAVNEWTGQHVSTHIAGEMLKKAGYQVEYVTAGYMNMYQAMADGEIHGAMEIWSSNVSDEYAKQVEAGGVTELGDLGLDAKEGIAYPAHVEEMCPGLPAWEALKDCAQNFRHRRDTARGPSGGLSGGLGDARCADRMTGLELPFKAVPAGSEGALDRRVARGDRQEIAAAHHLLATALGDVGL